MPPESDRQRAETIDLLARIAREDRAALAELYDAYAARLNGLALMILKDAGAAEDALQEVFLQIWRRAGLFDSRRGHPVAWLLRVCRNLCIDRLRRRAGQAEHAGEWMEAAGVAGPHSDPESQLEIEELQAAVGNAMNRLTGEEQRLVRLAYFEGQTQREIALAMNLPLGTVKTRMQKALRRLRADLEQYA